MKTFFIRRLRAQTQLSEEDLAAIEALPMQVKDIERRTPFVREGDRPSQCCLILEGFAVRSKTTDEGKRQILAIHIPGEMPDLHSLHLKVMDHDLSTLSKCQVGFINHDAIHRLTRERPDVASALWRETLVDAAVFREWIVNVGRRDATARLAHVVAELRERLNVIGLLKDHHFGLPMTQMDLADTLGLTPIHVNRVLQQLRKEGVLDIKKETVSFASAERLDHIADFDELYLHQHPMQ
jgi:CRP-like cAMP-binding protein